MISLLAEPVMFCNKTSIQNHRKNQTEFGIRIYSFNKEYHLTWNQNKDNKQRSVVKGVTLLVLNGEWFVLDSCTQIADTKFNNDSIEQEKQNLNSTLLKQTKPTG